jgi:hypothetical protein
VLTCRPGIIAKTEWAGGADDVTALLEAHRYVDTCSGVGGAGAEIVLTHGDLHTHNMLLLPSGDVTLVDLELSGKVELLSPPLSLSLSLSLSHTQTHNIFPVANMAS